MCVSFLTPAFAGSNNPLPATEVPKDVLAHQIESRIYEIRNMDKTNLTAADKKELRKEVKGLRREARRNGIYLSIGAIIVVILLLILILR